MTRVVMVIEGHDWREKVIYHDAEQRHRIERVPGKMICIICHVEKAAGETATPCHEVWSKRTGYLAAPSYLEAVGDT